jgi:hypothetical protein
VIRTQTEECVGDGIAYRWETTRDDETRNAEICECDQSGRLVRRCEWSIWSEHERRDDLIGEAVWFDAEGAEIERLSLRERP